LSETAIQLAGPARLHKVAVFRMVGEFQILSIQLRGQAHWGKRVNTETIVKAAYVERSFAD
jgi:hypothetical protein